MVANLCFRKPIDVADTIEHKVSLNDLPDEILILIFNRLLDLKCLCLCSLVSPRFSSLILFHVHSVSFAVPHPNPPSNTLSKKILRIFRRVVFGATRKPLPFMMSPFYSDSLPSALYFLSKFKSIRSLHLILPNPKPKPKPNDSLFFTWTVKFGSTADTLVFVFASSIRAGNVDQQEDYSELIDYKLQNHRIRLAVSYVYDAIMRHKMLLFLIEEHPLLQNITITNSVNQGNAEMRDSKLAEMRDWFKLELKKIEVPVSVNFKKQSNLSSRDSKLAEFKNWVSSARLKIEWAVNNFEVQVSLEQWHVPKLELPMPGKVMKSATLVLMEMADRNNLHRGLGGDAASIANLFEKGDEEFGEAIVEMMMNHQSEDYSILTSMISCPYLYSLLRLIVA